MARPPHPHRHPHRRGARHARRAAEEGEWSARGRRAQHRRPHPVGRADQRHPRRRARPTSRRSTRSSSASTSRSRRRARAEPVTVWEVVGGAGRRGRAPRAATPLVGREAELARARRVLRARCATSRRRHRDDRRRARHRQEPAPARARPTRSRTLRRPLGPLPLVRRGHHVLAGRGDLRGRRRDPRRATTARRSRRSSTRSSTRSRDRRPRRAADDRRGARRTSSASPTTPRGTYATSEISQAELHWGIRRALELLAAEQPTRARARGPALGRADAVRADRVHRRRRRRRAAPRPRHRAARARASSRPAFSDAERRRRTIELDAARRRGGERALLAELLGDRRFGRHAVAEALLANAGGNPLFLEETVRMLDDAGALRPRAVERRRQASCPCRRASRRLIGSRLDRLAAQEKSSPTTRPSSVHVFWSGAVAHLGTQDGDRRRIRTRASPSSSGATSSRIRGSRPPSRATSEYASSTS